MINLTRLLCNVEQPADGLRYGQGAHAALDAGSRKPVVVWNITRTCNLRCVHCYSSSAAAHYPNELQLHEFKTVIDDLAQYGVQRLLLSGGEPTLHPHFWEIAEYAVWRGLRLTLSTNGTRIDLPFAKRLKELGFAYIGISLDGIGEAHDQFRGMPGTFEKVMNAFRACRKADQKSGLRLTLTTHTVQHLDQILDFIENEEIQRVCFYHLVYSGRGADLSLLKPNQTRSALDRIMRRVEEWHQRGMTREVLTVDQPADGPYLWMKLREQNSQHAATAYQLLAWNGGGAHGSGRGIANIDSQGHVHPDQFWQTYDLGSVREKPFSEIWERQDDPLLTGLRNRTSKIKGRCSQCAFLKICGGGFRVRAWQRYGDPWESDPGCYLSESEITAPSLHETPS